MHIIFTQPVPWFSTPFRLLSKLLRFRTLWAYGFDSTARRAPEKLKTFFLQPTLLFKKQIAECHQDWRKPP